MEPVPRQKSASQSRYSPCLFLLHLLETLLAKVFSASLSPSYSCQAQWSTPNGPNFTQQKKNHNYLNYSASAPRNTSWLLFFMVHDFCVPAWRKPATWTHIYREDFTGALVVRKKWRSLSYSVKWSMASASAENTSKSLRTDPGKRGQRKEVRQTCNDLVFCSSLCMRIYMVLIKIPIWSQLFHFGQPRESGEAALLLESRKQASILL